MLPVIVSVLLHIRKKYKTCINLVYVFEQLYQFS